MSISQQSYFVYRTPVGFVSVGTDGKAITQLALGEHALYGERRPSEITNHAAQELQEYFAGKRREFDLPLSPEGTEFQKRVWEALKAIPYGETSSYANIAAAIGSPQSQRAVGTANNKNPIQILIPCHRVIASNGKIGGYAAGVSTKKFLLDLEGSSVKA